MAIILLVDDFASNREFFVNVPGQKGRRLLEAGDGPEALALAEDLRPDLTMDGFEFIGQLRAIPATAAIPVIFCTADYLERDTYNLAQASGNSRVLVKPCDPHQVVHTVNRGLGLNGSETPSAGALGPKANPGEGATFYFSPPILTAPAK